MTNMCDHVYDRDKIMEGFEFIHVMLCAFFLREEFEVVVLTCFTNNVKAFHFILLSYLMRFGLVL